MSHLTAYGTGISAPVYLHFYNWLCFNYSFWLWELLVFLKDNEAFVSEGQNNKAQKGCYNT